MNLTLLPRPDRTDEGPGRWSPGEDLLSAVVGTRFGDPLPAGITRSPGDEADTSVPVLPGSYRLSADAGGIRIIAADDEGCWNALQTLKQILRQAEREDTLPELNIVDHPTFAVRGIMLDVSRTRVPSMETLRQLIAMWAELKINQLQLYIEHTFAYEGHEMVWKDSSPFTPDEIRTIDQWCRSSGMDLVPNQNSIGHMERWLKHPEYHSFAEAPQGYEDPWGVYREHASTLDLQNPKSMDLLKNLYDQYLPCFSSRQFNIGGDEPYDLGKGSNQAACEEAGAGPFYLGYLKKVCDEVESRGYRPQFWADIILNYPELLDRVPEGAVVMNWGYEADHPFEKETWELSKSGRDFQVCPGTSSWNALAGRWENARENIRSAARWGEENGASGYLITDWGDNGHWQQYVASLPGWFAGAAAAWNGKSGAEEDVSEAMQVLAFGRPHGEEARNLLKLADLYRENPVKLHNMSFLILPLLDHEYPYYRTQYREIRKTGMGRAGEIVREVDTSPGHSPGNTWCRQLAFTARIMSFAADLAEVFYQSEDFRIERNPPEIRESFAARLEELMDDYSELWREICRPGGLDESLKGFSGLQELLRS